MNSAGLMVTEFTNIRNNSATVDIICVFNSNTNGVMNYSNVINNTVSERAIIYAPPNLNFSDSNFLDNFAATNIMFEVMELTGIQKIITLYDCYVLNPYAEKNNGKVVSESPRDSFVDFEIPNIQNLFDVDNLFPTYKNCITICQNISSYNKMSIFVFIFMIC